MSEETIKLTKEAQSIVDMVEKMNVLELSDLVKVLEDRFGVTAAAPVAAVAAPISDGSEQPAEEAKDEVDVILQSTGDKKIPVLKVVRSITGLGLKEAKSLVDGVPKAVKEGVTRAVAEELKVKLEAEGATIEIK